MIRAIFVAPQHRQADYWARQWGYNRGEWMFIATNEPWRLLGYDKWDYPVYICGNEPPNREVYFQLDLRGFRVYYAESLETTSV